MIRGGLLAAVAAILVACAPSASMPAGVACDRLVYWSDHEGDREIYILSDGEITRVTDGGNNVNPTWSPDGSQILFTSGRDGDLDLYVMNEDGSDALQLTYNNVVDSSSDWSETRGEIVLDRDTADDEADPVVQIFVMPADGFGEHRQLTEGAPNAKPVWSPDGTRVAFLSLRDGNQEIYVMDADGSDQVNLTRDPALDALAAWSPDGSRLAFVSDRDGNREIYVMNADGSNPMRLTDEAAEDGNPTWSLDGRHILFTSDRDPIGIYVMAADGTDVEFVTVGSVHDCSGS